MGEGLDNLREPILDEFLLGIYAASKLACIDLLFASKFFLIFRNANPQHLMEIVKRDEFMAVGERSACFFGVLNAEVADKGSDLAVFIVDIPGLFPVGGADPLGQGQLISKPLKHANDYIRLRTKA